jgi:hypothetical protein
LHFPSYWEAIGVVTPENKKLYFVVEIRVSTFTLLIRKEEIRNLQRHKTLNLDLPTNRIMDFMILLFQKVKFCIFTNEQSLDYVSIVK